MGGRIPTRTHTRQTHTHYPYGFCQPVVIPRGHRPGGTNKDSGIKITRKGDSITLSQVQYIETILQNQGMLNTNPIATLLDPHIPIEPNPEGNEGS